MGQNKAYGLLADQPLSVREILADQRRDIVISAVIDQDGETHVLSRYTDMVWELWPFFVQSNVTPYYKKIDWTNIPVAFREIFKAVTYRYWMVGLPGKKPPCAKTLRMFVDKLVIFTRYLDGLGVRSMSEVRHIHISNYVHEMKMVKRLAPNTLAQSFRAIENLYRFADQHTDGLSFHPWPDSSHSEVAGLAGHAHEKSSCPCKTRLIPKQIAETLFCFAEGVLNGADAILDERDSGLRTIYRDKECTLIRNACFYLLGVLTGMRGEELVGVEVGAGRTEIKDGVTYHWVKSIEHKTLKGAVEYLMPSMGHEILRILERTSAPFHQRLRKQLANWEENNSAEGRDKRLQRISSARADLNRLFLGMGPSGICAVSGEQCRQFMRQFAAQAGVDWKLAPHQMRRLYGWTFVRHRLGNLLFLKEQFKHSTIDMSQLYAANPKQDAAIYDEILKELRSQKADIIQSALFDDQPLAGGAGKKIMKLRAHHFPNRKAMIEETLDKLNLRSTGHGWCLAQDEGCGGAGMYELGRCGTCSNSLIDSSHKLFWLEVYRHTGELLEEVHDLGPGAASRIHRDYEIAKKVLKDLGIDVGEGGGDGQSDIPQ